MHMEQPTKCAHHDVMLCFSSESQKRNAKMGCTEIKFDFLQAVMVGHSPSTAWKSSFHSKNPRQVSPTLRFSRLWDRILSICPPWWTHFQHLLQLLLPTAHDDFRDSLEQKGVREGEEEIAKISSPTSECRVHSGFHLRSSVTVSICYQNSPLRQTGRHDKTMQIAFKNVFV